MLLSSISAEEWAIIGLSLRVSLTAVFAMLPIAFALAWLLARYRFPGKLMLDALVHLPLVVPPVVINGDGETSRDFCYVDNAVQANLLSALTERPDAVNTVYNVAAHRQTSLNQLFAAMRGELVKRFPEIADAQAHYQDFRAGDVRHSLADISRAQSLLGYAPSHDVTRGLAEAMDWYVARFAPEMTA